MEQTETEPAAWEGTEMQAAASGVGVLSDLEVRVDKLLEHQSAFFSFFLK